MKIAVIGAGEMGGAFATGLLRGSIFRPSDIIVSNRSEGRLQPFAEAGAVVTTDNVRAASDADIVAIVVKPAVVEQVCTQLRDVLHADRQIVVNMAASVPLSSLRAWLRVNGVCPPLFQVMPNIGIAVQRSMTFIVPDAEADRHTATVRQLFDDLGRTIIVDESLLPAGNALAGCGIAFVMRYVRAAAEAGVELGLRADTATEIVLQTMQGAVDLLRHTGSHPEAEIDKVTTPGGLTIRGLNTMERGGFSSALIEGIKAAVR